MCIHIKYMHSTKRYHIQINKYINREIQISKLTDRRTKNSSGQIDRQNIKKEKQPINR